MSPAQPDQAILACDVGGTRLKLGLVGPGTLLAESELAAEPGRGLAVALERIAKGAEELCAKTGRKLGALGGLGLAFPGIVQPGTGRILAAPAGKFEDACTLDVADWTKSRLGVPLFVCNDANAALAAEYRFGAARGCRSVVMVTLGTGFGSSAIIDGVPLRGQHGQAGCLGGHLLAKVDGRACRCGNIGCVETEASTWALPELVRSRPQWSKSVLAAAKPDYGEAFRLATAGEAAAKEICAHSIRVWAAAIVSLIHAYDPERVIVGGGLMRSADLILPGLRGYIARHAWTPWGKIEIVSAALGNSAGMLGVADLLAQSLAANSKP